MPTLKQRHLNSPLIKFHKIITKTYVIIVMFAYTYSDGEYIWKDFI